MNFNLEVSQQDYISSVYLDKQKVQIKIIGIEDQNHVLKQVILYSGFQDVPDNIEYFIHAQLFNGNKKVEPPIETPIFKKIFHDESVIIQSQIVFNCYYKDLNYNAYISLTLWSMQKKYDSQEPLASTVISLYDEYLTLRQGKYMILLWPNRLPDLSFHSSTNGFVKDYDVSELNHCLRLHQNMEQKENITDLDNKSNQILSNRIYFIKKKIAYAFLDIIFPVFSPNSQAKILFEEPTLTKNLIYERKKNDWNALIVHKETSQECPIQSVYLKYILDQEDPRTAIPNIEQIKIIEGILKKSNLIEKDKISDDVKFLFWRFRYWLSSNSNALTKFLILADFTIDEYKEEVIHLLQIWEPISLDDALYLLSGYFCTNSFYQKSQGLKNNQAFLQIRYYAIEILKKTPKSDIRLILLQLVQALRYEKTEDSPLAEFLLQQSTEKLDIATEFYWFLKVECQNEIKNPIYKQTFQKFNDFITLKPQIQQQIDAQNQFRESLNLIVTRMKKKNLSIDLKKIDIKTSLESQEFIESFSPHFSSLNTDFYLKKLIKSNVFKSTTSPVQLQFETNQEPYIILFKNGDDLRQDQLVIEMFNIFDFLLKNINVDLQLQPYRVLACSKEDGFLEFVKNSETVGEIMKKGSISEYLNNLKGDQVKQNFIMSCAGYCVITYLLGVGDRHLDNVMIDNQGRFFHIDFGYILDKDPKAYPPPLKLSKEMVDAMKSMSNDQVNFYDMFLKKSIETYLYFRKYAKYITNLFFLMMDSNIKDLNLEALKKMIDKFCIDQNDENAELHFQNKLDESINSLFGKMNDKFHEWATYWKR